MEERRCPKCGGRQERRGSMSTPMLSGEQNRRAVYVCVDCGKKDHVAE